MPVTDKPNTTHLYQRDQYAKGGIGRYYWDFRDRAIFKCISVVPQFILDAGCGEGITLEKLNRLFPNANIHGIDSLDENIAICKEHGLFASKGDLAHLEMPSEMFDCCILSEVIEHCENHREILCELHRVLKPQGILIIVFPNDFIFKIARLLTFKFKEASYDPGHVKQWSLPEMKKALEMAGFDVKKLSSLPLPIWPLSLHGIAMAVRKAS